MMDVERLALKECLMNLTVVDLKRIADIPQDVIDDVKSEIFGY